MTLTPDPSPSPVVEGRPRPLWHHEIATQAAFKRLIHPGWDGPGSDHPSDATIDRMVWILSLALSEMDDADAPALCAAGDGSLQAEWHRHEGDLEFCLDADGSADTWVRLVSKDAVVEFNDQNGRAVELLCRYARRLACRTALAQLGAETGEGER